MPLESLTQKGQYWERISLPEIGGLAPGVYSNPTMTVDEFGRITAISSNPIPGTIQSLDEGVAVPSGPFGVLNFTGPGIIASDGGSGQLDIFVPGGGSGVAVEDEGTLLVGGPHTIFDFVGENVTVTNSGLGRAHVEIVDPDNFVRFRKTTIGTSVSTGIGTPIEDYGIIRRVVVTITTQYTAGATIEVQDGLGTVLMPTTGNNPQLVGTYELDLPANTSPVGVGGEQLVAIVGGAPVGGDAIIEVRYNTP